MNSISIHNTRYRIASLLVLFLFFAVACSPGQTNVSQEEADQAFMVSYAAMFVGSMTVALEHTRAGISVNKAERTITLEGFDVTDLQTPYETVSGTITGQESSSVIEFELVGGPATTVSFEIAASEMLVDDRIEQRVTVNGREFDINLDREALEL